MQRVSQRTRSETEVALLQVDVFDTYTPFVSWNTVRLLLILSVVLSLNSKQVDCTAAFVQSKLAENEQVFVEMPRGFQKEGHVLRLKRALYGLKQSPRTWFEHLKANLDACGFKQSPNDLCLFYTDNVICLVYVDDCLFFAPDETDIDDILAKIENTGLDFNIEDDVAGFLGVLITPQDDGSVKLTQTGLIARIILALGLEGASKNETPAEYGALAEDPDGMDCQEEFNYPSVLGMMGYLLHTRPEISFAVSQCGKYSSKTKHSHEVALKRIGRYLVGTREEGLILSPDRNDISVEMYVDADFAGMHGYEDPENPESIRSRTGFVAKCPVLWVSKMQTETALSTMMAEYIALSTGMRDLIVLKRLAEEVSAHVGLADDKVATIKAKTVVHEDNNGALILANLEPGRSTPTSKFFNVKYHWFREQLIPKQIVVVKVETNDQLADIFTKGLKGVKFKEMRLKLCGW
jgi:hypothetical protein